MTRRLPSSSARAMKQQILVVPTSSAAIRPLRDFGCGLSHHAASIPSRLARRESCAALRCCRRSALSRQPHDQRGRAGADRSRRGRGRAGRWLALESASRAQARRRVSPAAGLRRRCRGRRFQRRPPTRIAAVTRSRSSGLGGEHVEQGAALPRRVRRRRPAAGGGSGRARRRGSPRRRGRPARAGRRCCHSASGSRSSIRTKMVSGRRRSTVGAGGPRAGARAAAWRPAGSKAEDRLAAPDGRARRAPSSARRLAAALDQHLATASPSRRRPAVVAAAPRRNRRRAARQPVPAQISRRRPAARRASAGARRCAASARSQRGRRVRRRAGLRAAADLGRDAARGAQRRIAPFSTIQRDQLREGDADDARPARAPATAASCRAGC